MEKYPKGISIQCSKKILEQMENSICIINGKDLGFFFNIKYDNKNIPCLITSYKVIDELYIANNISVEVKINEKIKTIEFARNFYYDESNNIIIIEVKENENNKIIFLDLDEKLYEKEIENNYFDNKSMYTIYQGLNQNTYVSYGIINYLNDSKILFSCNIDTNTKFSPIFNLSNNKIIGIYNRQSKYYKKGIFLKFIINEFIKCNYDKNMENEIDILINIEKDDINKKIYFLDNYYYDFKSFEKKYNNLIQLNKLNSELFINNIKQEYKKYLIPDKEGKYNIKLKFKNNITNTNYMFSGCENIKSINFINFNTDNITNMKGMFFNCRNLKKINLFSFDNKNVIDMSYMFYGCEQLNNLDLSSFDFKNVKNIDNIFSNCEKLNNILIPPIKNRNVNIKIPLKQEEITNSNNYSNKFDVLSSSYSTEHDLTFNLIIFGNSAEGNKKLIQTGIGDILKNNYNRTLGFGYITFNLKYQNKIIKLKIFDIIKDINLFNNALTYRNTSLIIIVYEINDIYFFQNIKNKIEYVRSKLSDKKLFLIGNKIGIPETE